jgi:hypothetical protein
VFALPAHRRDRLARRDRRAYSAAAWPYLTLSGVRDSLSQARAELARYRAAPMRSTARLCLGLVTFSSFLAFTACGDDDDSSPGSAGRDNEGGAQSSAGGSGASGSEAKGGEAHGGGGHVEAPVICQVLGTLCHEADTGPGMGRDCHQLGHASELETCEEQFSSCIGFCVGAETGTGGAGGGSGADQDPYCAALGSLCHPIEDGMGPECHDIGHEGDAAACAESFDQCAHFCLEARDALEPGAGGSGGGQSASAGAGGAQ